MDNSENTLSHENASMVVLIKDLVKSAVEAECSGLLRSDLNNITDQGKSMISQNIRKEITDSDEFLTTVTEKVTKRIDDNNRKSFWGKCDTAMKFVGYAFSAITFLCAVSEAFKGFVSRLVGWLLGIW